MADILLDVQSPPVTPAAGQAVIYVDNASKLLSTKDDVGVTRSLGETPHNILSATHPDTLADSVVQGDIIVGNATPKWARLAANATATKKYLQSVSSGIPSWQQIAYADLSGGPLNNVSLTDQGIPAGTSTYLTNSNIVIPVGNLRIGTVFKWRLGLTKTAAGTAASVFHVKLGPAASISDQSLIQFTTPTGTAAVDAGQIFITVTIRGPISAFCNAQGTFWFGHNLTTTGLITTAMSILQVNSIVFDATASNLNMGLSVVPGASVAFTFQQIVVEALNL